MSEVSLDGLVNRDSESDEEENGRRERRRAAGGRGGRGGGQGPIRNLTSPSQGNRSYRLSSPATRCPASTTTNEDVELFHDFMRMLAPPTRARIPFGGSIASQQGSRVFDQIGCADCHVTPLRSGPTETAALRFQGLQPFSDFLLHDMGSLGDGIEQGRASGREMRTAPLWGLPMLTTFLHDGRAHAIDDAIRAHPRVAVRE